MKNENSKLNQQITSLKNEIAQTEKEKKKSDTVKADLEYNLRAAEYNVEILKNQNENLNTELQLLKMHSEKQKTFIQIQKQKYERIGQDMEYYKKQAKKGKNDAIPSVRGSINPNSSKMLID